MTREQAEKLRQENRRKRLRKKRIKAFSLLALFIVLAAAIVFFAVKQTKKTAVMLLSVKAQLTKTQLAKIQLTKTKQVILPPKAHLLQAKNRQTMNSRQAPHLLAQNLNRAGAQCL